VIIYFVTNQTCEESHKLKLKKRLVATNHRAISRQRHRATNQHWCRQHRQRRRPSRTYKTIWCRRHWNVSSSCCRPSCSCYRHSSRIEHNVASTNDDDRPGDDDVSLTDLVSAVLNTFCHKVNESKIISVSVTYSILELAQYESTIVRLQLCILAAKFNYSGSDAKSTFVKYTHQLT